MTTATSKCTQISHTSAKATHASPQLMSFVRVNMSLGRAKTTAEQRQLYPDARRSQWSYDYKRQCMHAVPMKVERGRSTFDAS